MEENKFTFVQLDEEASEHISAPVYSYWKSVARVFFKDKFAIFMLVVAIVIVLVSLIQPMFSGYSPIDSTNINNPAMKFLGPSLQYPFGTDNIGLSLFDAVFAGCGESLKLAGLVTLINMTIGIAVGAVWGYSKKVDKFMMEIYNIFANVPYTLVLMVLAYVLPTTFGARVFTFTITGWLGIAFFIRTQVMIIRDREYNLASKCLGTGMSRMVTKNILPYMVSVIMTLISREIPSIIANEVFLSYVNIGNDMRRPSIGVMISNYTSYMNVYPHLFWFPVIVLGLVSVSLYVVGQTLADASDPRTHR